ncbi:hypothetical protein J3Q00_07640 [Pseudomonas sp. D2-3]
MAVGVLSIARSYAKSFLWRLKLIFPDLVFKSSVTFDETENLETTPDEREEINSDIVWGAEVYGPSEVDQLLNNLMRLKWSAGHGGRGRANAAEWVRQKRLTGRIGWYNVGIIARSKDTARFLMPPHTMDLPKEADFLKVQIFQLSASLTCVVVGVILKEGERKRYAQILSAKYKGRFVRGEKNTAIRMSPRDFKAADVEKARTHYRRIVQSWFADNLPGCFCSSGIDFLPTAELLSTKFRSIYEEGSFQEDWRSVLNSPVKADIWTAQGGSGIQLSTCPLQKLPESFHLLAGVCRNDLDHENLKGFGDESNAYLSYSSEFIPEVLSNYAAISYLAETLKAVRLSRSSLQLLGVDACNQVSVLARIQLFFNRSLSAPVVASELKSIAKASPNFLFGHGDYTATNWGDKTSKQSLNKFICFRISDLSGRLLLEEHSLREHFSQLANIISIRESLRAQNSSMVLTVLAVIIATASMVITALQSPAWVLELKRLLV